MFADNIVIWTRTKTTINKMSSMLQMLWNWATKEINTTKLVYQILSLRHQNPLLILKYDNRALSRSETTRHLGVFLDNNLRCYEHLKKIIEKVNLRKKLLKGLAAASWGST